MVVARWCNRHAVAMTVGLPLSLCTTDQQVCVYQHSNSCHQSRVILGTTQTSS